MIGDEFSGSFRLRDEVEGADLFCGVRMWEDQAQVGISINDGRGGPAESIVFTDRVSRWAFGQLFALMRRNAYRRRREFAPLYAALSTTTERHA